MGHLREHNHMAEMKEIRCKKCNRLLFKYSDDKEEAFSDPEVGYYFGGLNINIEIFCPKCKHIEKVKLEY